MIKKNTKKRQVLIVIVLTLFTGVFNAQNIQFQGVDIEMPSNLDLFDWNLYPESSQDNLGYYGWIRFANTPSQAIQDELKNDDYKLLAYYPNKVYLFNFPKNASTTYLIQKGAESIIPLSNDQKMSKTVRTRQFPGWAIKDGKILLSFTHFDTHSANDILIELSKFKSLEIVKVYKNSNIFDVAISESDINTFTSQVFIKWIDVIIPPSVKDDLRGRSLHRSTNLDTGSSAGRQYTGDGVGVMVRDDGMVGPHIDFQGRHINSTNSNGGTHGDGVAGIMAGAGNLNPLFRGMAAGSEMYVVDYVSNFLDSATLNPIVNGDVQITNSSFSNGCNNGYTSVSRTVDQQTNTYPELLHVFSAGNSGTENCGYGAGSGWGNITGGHKLGKNVIATANVFFNGQLAESSSRGPSTDGRIKPDITAHGQGQISTDENNNYLTFGGTSAAAPGIAGVAAQLYEAYADLNGGSLPESALIKATMLNTANDYGNVGPDFKFGWGLVNGLRAAMLIEDGHYLDNMISQSESSNHSITVPPNTKQLKVMLYWSDVEGASGASPALVNDLDLSVLDPINNTNFPYLLDSTPTPFSLNSPASSGFDRLNNVEQVVINNPLPGTYTLNVDGFNVPLGPQKYYIVYDIIEEGLTVTYPSGNETIISNSTDVIHWDGFNLVGNTTVEYSADNGANWTSIGTVSVNTKNIQWNVPNDIGGNYIVRVTNNGLTAQSAQTFSVAPRVNIINFQTVCPTQATISWNPILEANSYDIYVLGDKYMEVIGSTTNFSYTFPISNPTEDIWVAVSASGDMPNNWKSLRSNAVLYNDGDLLNCPLNTDLSVASINNTALDFNPICDPTPVVISADVTNGGTNPEVNFTMSYQINSEPVIEEVYTNTINPGATETYTFSVPVSNLQNGANVLRVWNNITGDEYLLNDEKVLEFNAFTTSTVIDFTEDFESLPTIPAGWIFNNPDDELTWVSQSVSVGSDGNSSQTLFMDNYFYNTNGEFDSFTTEYFDLNFNGSPELNFDLAKAQFSQNLSDGFRVEVSIDCGQTYQEVYFKEGLTLSTLPNYFTSIWQPNSTNDWRTEVIDLTPYLGNDILVRFTNINGYGNSTFIDNINLIKNELLSTSENPLLNAVQIYPNPTKGVVNLELNTNYGSKYSLVINNVLGQTLWQSKETDFNQKVNRSLDFSKFNTGTYFITVFVGDTKVVKKFIKI